MRNRYLRVLVAVMFLVACFQPMVVMAWDKNKAWLEKQLQGTADTPGESDPRSYIGQAMTRAKAKYDRDGDGVVDPSAAGLTSHGGLGDRKYWAAKLDPLGPLKWLGAWADDMKANFVEDFGGCVDPEVDIDWGFDIDVNLSMYWPEYQVHTHPIFQNRYGDLWEIIKTVALVVEFITDGAVQLMPTYLSFPQPYPALYAIDAHAMNLPGIKEYPIHRYLIQPNMMGHAKFNMQHDLFQKYKLLIPALEAAGMDSSFLQPDWALYAAPLVFNSLRYNPLNPYNFEFLDAANSDAMNDLKLDEFGPLPEIAPDDREYRYASVPVNNTHTLEFSIMPTMFKMISSLIPIIALLPRKCRPSPKYVYPWDSDKLEMYLPTRDPFVGLGIYTEDRGFRDDYKRWLQNPKACTEYKMVKHGAYANIPFDQFDSRIELPLLPDIQLPDLLTPISNRRAGDYARMCTIRSGANVPFTIYNNPQGPEVVAALQNLEKASRLENAYYLQYIQDDPELNALMGFAPIDKARDKIQFTYHDDVTHKCMRVGQLGELFNGANAMVKKGEYGLYSVTVWKKYSCDIGLGDIVLLTVGLLTMWPTILALFALFGL